MLIHDLHAREHEIVFLERRSNRLDGSPLTAHPPKALDDNMDTTADMFLRHGAMRYVYDRLARSDVQPEGLNARCTGCWPPRSGSQSNLDPRMMTGWGFYSPGIAYPTGFRLSRWSRLGEAQGWNVEYSILPGETEAACCPRYKKWKARQDVEVEVVLIPSSPQRLWHLVSVSARFADYGTDMRHDRNEGVVHDHAMCSGRLRRIL